MLLSSRLQAVESDFRPARIGEAYLIAVEDSGPGIPQPLQSRVFERFFRAGHSSHTFLKTPAAGAGLGLAISRWIAEAHHGSLALTSSGPTGSNFHSYTAAMDAAATKLSAN